MPEQFSEEWVDKKVVPPKDKKPPKKPERWMVTNSAGKKSASLTLLIIVVTICLLRLLLGGLVLKVGNLELGMKDVDLLTLSAFVTPFLALYGGRRFTDTRANGSTEKKDK